MAYALGLLLLAAGCILLVYGFRLYGQPRVRDRVAHWQNLFSGLEESPHTLYTRVYQAFRDSLQEREIALYGFGFGPQRLFATASLFAERPLYLQVRYKHLCCYLYAGQTPGGLFVTTWYYDKHVLGERGLIAPTKKAWRYFSQQTLFEHDAALMFIQSVQEIVTGVLNGYLEEKGLQPMEALERRPILHAFYQHPFAHDPFYRNAENLNGFGSNTPNPANTSSRSPSSPPSTPPTPTPLFGLDPIPEEETIDSNGAMPHSEIVENSADNGAPVVTETQTSTPEKGEPA